MTAPLTHFRAAPRAMLPPLVALLLALCALLSCSPSLAQSGNAATFVSQSVPSAMTPARATR